MGGWCLMRIGHDVSSVSLGWSLLPSTVIIVLALINSAMSPVGTLSISTRPRSAALLPVSTTSTGLLHLLVGAHVHCVRSNTEKYHMWPLPYAHHFQCMTYICHASARLPAFLSTIKSLHPNIPSSCGRNVVNGAVRL